MPSVTAERPAFLSVRGARSPARRPPGHISRRARAMSRRRSVPENARGAALTQFFRVLAGGLAAEVRACSGRGLRFAAAWTCVSDFHLHPFPPLRRRMRAKATAR